MVVCLSFINDPVQLVSDSLHQLTITNPSLALDQKHKIARYIQPPGESPTVSIISGGGSGHEPAFGAYVGKGLLSSAVAGTIFASPSSEQILHAIEQTERSRGVLVTVLNYTGDVLNFGLAIEKAKARWPDLKIEMLVVGDDVGVPRSQAGRVRRRGLAGASLVYKITGAAAAQGQDLSQIVKIGQQVCEKLASIGVSLNRVHVPGHGKLNLQDQLAEDEVELGMGIHNERGSERRRGERARLLELVREMFAYCLSQDDTERSFIKNISKDAVLLVNNLGGLGVLEIGATTTEVVRQLSTDHQIRLLRVYSGAFMTSLDCPGFSLCLLFLQHEQEDVILSLLDHPIAVCGWTGAREPTFWLPLRDPRTNASPVKHVEPLEEQSRLLCDLTIVIEHLEAGLHATITAEPEVTEFDTVVGDGDCGMSMKRGAGGKLVSFHYLSL